MRTNYRTIGMFCLVKQFFQLSRNIGRMIRKVHGGYSWGFLVGMCRRVIQFLTFQTKKLHFLHPSLDLASKKLKVYASLLSLEQ